MARVRVVSPVSVAPEVPDLARAGADELYCGVIPSTWGDRYGNAAWLNRRGFDKANLRGIEGLRDLCEVARRHDLRVSVTLNAPYYTAEQVAEVLELCRELVDVGVGGVIVADVGLVRALASARLALGITISSVAAANNTSACALFRDLGASRIVLPRHLTLPEIERIRDGVRDVQLEVFILNDGCVFEEGLCSTTHALGAFCLAPWRYGFERVDGKELSEPERERLSHNAEEYQRWTWFNANCGASLSPKGLPNGPCGLCAIEPLVRMGIDGVKIVGREAHPSRKLKSVQLVRAVLDKVEAGASAEEARDASRALRDTAELCDAGYMCYYRGAPAATRAAPPSLLDDIPR